EESGEHWSVSPRAHGARLVIAEAEMGGEEALAADGLDRAIEDVDETARTFAVRIAAHGRLVDRDLAATRRHQRLEFGADGRQQGLGDGEAIRILTIRKQPSAEGVRTGDAGLEHRAAGGDLAQALELRHHAQSAGRG